MGYNGKHCVLRALCESTQYFYKKGSNMVEELVRTIFSLPKSRVLSYEQNSILEYDSAHRKGRNKIHCSQEYPCSFSLIEMALGTFSNQLKFMWDKHFLLVVLIMLIGCSLCSPRTSFDHFLCGEKENFYMWSDKRLCWQKKSYNGDTKLLQTKETQVK